MQAQAYYVRPLRVTVANRSVQNCTLITSARGHRRDTKEDTNTDTTLRVDIFIRVKSAVSFPAYRRNKHLFDFVEQIVYKVFFLLFTPF